MTRLIVLDAGPLGMVTSPKSTPTTVRAAAWLQRLLVRNVSVAIPEVADYEVRRELVRMGSRQGIAKLDDLQGELFYLPLTTTTMRRAAELWARCRNEGLPLADPHALDCDVILAAQAAEARSDYDEVVIATTNPDHLSRLVAAKHWDEIS
jgi:predicted nucleic acid-binding protein